MKLTNEFVVEAPLEQTWRTLLDVPRVARALPGATIEQDGEGTYRGNMKVKLGPMTTEYKGTAELQDVDEDEHVASFRVQGREARGQGTAAATITSRVSPEGELTRVAVETDLRVTGRQAQFGRGIMEDVAGSLLGEFARRLELELGGGAPKGAAAESAQAAAEDSAPPQPQDSRAAQPGASATAQAESEPAPPRFDAAPAEPEDDVLDVGSAVLRQVLERAVLVALGLFFGLLAGRLIWKR